MNIRRMEIAEREALIQMVWETFLHDNAKKYSEEGISSFYSFLHQEDLFSLMQIYGAYEEEVLVGILAMRDSHISLFFVREGWQRQGIGKRLFQVACRECASVAMTVNSAPNAVTVYEHLGFQKVNSEQEKDGIRYIPMCRIANAIR